MEFNKEHLKDLAELAHGDDWPRANETLMVVSPSGQAATLYNNKRNLIAYLTPARVLALLAENARLAAAAPRQAVPEGYVLMPKRLTAENGAKSLFMGEFKEAIDVPCHECYGAGDEDCNECDSTGKVAQDVIVGWDTIKNIYALAVKNFSAPVAAIEQPPSTLAASLELIAQSWDECICEGIGEDREIGAVLREQFAKIAAPSSTAVPPADVIAAALAKFAAWKGYDLPSLNSDGNFDKDWLHREWVAFKAGLARAEGAAPTAAQAALTQQAAPDQVTSQVHPESALPSRASVAARPDPVDASIAQLETLLAERRASTMDHAQLAALGKDAGDADLDAADHALGEVGKALADAGYDEPDKSLADSIRALAAERDSLRAALVTRQATS